MHQKCCRSTTGGGGEGGSHLVPHSHTWSLNLTHSHLQVGQVVEALVLKYVALTHDELEEWRDDPEGYIRWEPGGGGGGGGGEDGGGGGGGGGGGVDG